MKGASLKTLIIERGYKQIDVARKLGESQQNFSSMLNAEDVRSSLIERISTALGIPVSQIYGEASLPIAATAEGRNNTAIAGNGNSVNSEKFLDLLKEKDQQIDKLLDIIKSPSK